MRPYIQNLEVDVKSIQNRHDDLKGCLCVAVRRLIGCKALSQWARHAAKGKGACFLATIVPSTITLVTWWDADLLNVEQLARNGKVVQILVLRRGWPIRIEVQIRHHAVSAFKEKTAESSMLWINARLPPGPDHRD